MRVEYSLTEDDLEVLIEWTRRHVWGAFLTWLNGPAQLVMGVLLTAMAGLLAIGGILDGWHDTGRIAWLVGSTPIAGLCLGLWWWNRSLPARLFSKLQRGNLTDDLVSELTSEGIRETSRVSESLWKWPMVKKMEATGEHLFVLLDNYVTLIIPRHGFVNDDAYQAFVETAHAFHADNLNG